jgi:A/G-specific adenine glycosylase
VWELAQTLLPARGSDMPAYTQGVMDLGATVCTRTQPRCSVCPVQAQCQAYQRGEASRFPIKTRTLRRTSQTWWWLLAMNRQGEVLLHKRPSKGIWADLHCLPLFEDEASVAALLPAAAKRESVHLPVVQHALTHRDLHLHTLWVHVGPRQADALAQAVSGRWCSPDAWAPLGLPAPVRQLLTQTPVRRARGGGAA